MEIQIEVINKFGSFLGEILKIDDHLYDTFLEELKKFHKKDSFEMNLIDGSIVLIPYDVIRNSVLTVKKIL